MSNYLGTDDHYPETPDQFQRRMENFLAVDRCIKANLRAADWDTTPRLLAEIIADVTRPYFEYCCDVYPDAGIVCVAASPPLYPVSPDRLSVTGYITAPPRR